MVPGTCHSGHWSQWPDRAGYPVQRPVLVIASGNPHKVVEIGAMLDAVELDLRQQPKGLEIEETGSTYLANACLKAEAVALLTGQWALADDSGLEVDALAGAPGVFSARYAPTDHERIHRLLQELGTTPTAVPASTAPWPSPILPWLWCCKPKASAEVRSSTMPKDPVEATTPFSGCGKRA